jgi:hypothetical protein
MARARVGKAGRDEDRFAAYDNAVAAVLQSQGIHAVQKRDVEAFARLVWDWLENRAAGHLPSTRTIRRHVYRRGLVATKDRG